MTNPELRAAIERYQNSDGFCECSPEECIDALYLLASAYIDTIQDEPNHCLRPPLGWHCTREAGHDGPCAAVPNDLRDFPTDDDIVRALSAPAPTAGLVEAAEKACDELRLMSLTSTLEMPVATLSDESPSEVEQLRLDNDSLRECLKRRKAEAWSISETLRTALAGASQGESDQRPPKPSNFKWMSICSHHREYNPTCKICQSGQWCYPETEQISQWLWKYDKNIWRKWANDRNTPDHLAQHFPNLGERTPPAQPDAAEPSEGVSTNPVGYRHSLIWKGEAVNVNLEKTTRPVWTPGVDCSMEYTTAVEPLYLSAPAPAAGVREAAEEVVRALENHGEEWDWWKCEAAIKSLRAALAGSPQGESVKVGDVTMYGHTITAHDWTEDFEHENGQYSCLCTQCENEFIGHKRRTICRLCEPPLEPDGSPSLPSTR